ncbi:MULTISPECIES: helix-turn-helix transcriptional regulator [Pectobacterium]|jgi:putative transcriptional regulator|uniref:helix-turn-helix transcriptional regulator n=1 Tax=Pectobacterium TaxID=122277 RepID=UPI000CDE6CEB|nr:MULTISPECIES: helix-turn-helix transcriptional regulator [Pectobacterium]MBN3145336.1 helix-turn-helix transcriptional regulator [Pectobacterium brasiliense]POY55708.1 hypothetical protein F018LOC_01644 [Pectobacterium versatile]PPE61913.1 hypothetical protein F157LOC_00747 [Pectobacterium brasiliense]
MKKSNNIKSVRERLGLSQSALAAEIGVSQGNISHYECQRQSVPQDVSNRIIDVAKKRGIEISFNDIYSS